MASTAGRNILSINSTHSKGEKHENLKNTINPSFFPHPIYILFLHCYSAPCIFVTQIRGDNVAPPPPAAAATTTTAIYCTVHAFNCFLLSSQVGILACYTINKSSVNISEFKEVTCLEKTKRFDLSPLELHGRSINNVLMKNGIHSRSSKVTTWYMC